MIFSDALVLDAPRRTSDGFLAVRARAAKSGVYSYSGAEVDPQNKHGLRDAASVNVLRDEATVFSPSSVRSFIGKPITDDHPSEAVTAANWRDHSRGVVMGAMRDGDHLAFDLVLMDAATIAKVEAGKVELSNGYTATLTHGDFTAPDGTKCQFRQDAVVGNHCAIVDRGRAGPTCRIGDAATCEALTADQLSQFNTKEKPVAHTMMVDGYSVDIADAKTAEATINKLVSERDTARTKLSDAETQVATLTTDKATLENENQQLKDAKPTPAQLRDAAKAYAAVVDKAKAHGVAVTDSMDEPAIIKATVLKHLGDRATAASGWTDAQFASSFATLKDAKAGDTVHPLGDVTVTDADKPRIDARTQMIADMLKPATAA